MNKIEVNELKKIQIKILNIFVEFCKENEMDYFLCGGTLIGAVRHQGYIPWDDDIDVALLRADYDKFIKKFNGYNDLFKVHTSDNTSDYPYPFAKISFVKTIIKEFIDEDSKIGVNIDIFPVDILPDKKVDQLKLLNSIRRYRNKLSLKLIRINKNRSFFKNTILLIGKLIYKFEKSSYLSSSINKIAKGYINTNTNSMGVIVWGYGECEVVSNNIFSEVIPMQFEGEYYNVPIGYHEWLTSIYGEYMKLPPKEKQISHHAFEAFWIK